MKLIADCGSSKIDWCVLDKGALVKQIFSVGMNAIMTTEDEMRSRIAVELRSLLGELADDIKEIYFYGAGCISAEVCGKVARALRYNIPTAETVEVYTDLLGAARALCGHEAGIACILGTGSNSCHYDGTMITKNVSPLGFILGDEGSGAMMGKLFIADVLKHQLPEELCERFLTEYNLDLLTIISRVYREPNANRFLASIVPFLKKNIELPEIHALVLGAFRAFFMRNIRQYDGCGTLAVNFVGSIAYHFSDILAEAARAESYHIGTIVCSPMEGLLKFHGEN